MDKIITEHNDFMTKDLKFFFNNIYYFGKQLGMDISALDGMLKGGFFKDFNDPNNMKIPHWQPNRRLFDNDFNYMEDIIDVIMKGYAKFNNVLTNKSSKDGTINIIFKYDNLTTASSFKNDEVLFFPLKSIALGSNDIINYKENYELFYKNIRDKSVSDIKLYIKNAEKMEENYLVVHFIIILII